MRGSGADGLADDGAGRAGTGAVGVADGDTGWSAVAQTAGGVGAAPSAGAPGRVVAQPAASTGASSSMIGYAGRTRRLIVGEGIRSSWQSRYREHEWRAREGGQRR
ncbi:hypothetical protein GCM10011576_23510 [Micromonospora parathelypteridis]|nr:hypothetical protein GCM10011576_23510 [Micromonospora parathelypteridis]